MRRCARKTSAVPLARTFKNSPGVATSDWRSSDAKNRERMTGPKQFSQVRDVHCRLVFGETEVKVSPIKSVVISDASERGGIQKRAVAFPRQQFGGAVVRLDKFRGVAV